jgi:WD40 repeat protein
VTPNPADSTASFRTLLLRALSAHEHAAATHLQAGRDASDSLRERLAGIAEQEREVTSHETHVYERQREAAREGHAQAEVMARKVAELRDSAASLLGQAGVPPTRTPSAMPTLPGGTGSAIGEQVRAAFGTAQATAVALRAGLLELAGAYAEEHRRDQSRTVLVSLRSAALAAFHDDVAASLYAACLSDSVAALSNDEWERARRLISAAIELTAGDRDHGAALEPLLHASSQLLECALAADRFGDAFTHVGLISRRVGSDHPLIRQWTHRHPMLSWACEQLACLEMGEHGRPVQDVAFTSDGQCVVSVDGTDARTWSADGPDRGRLLHVTPAPEAYWLTGDGILAVSTDGNLCRTRDGTVAGNLTGPGSGGLAGFSSPRGCPSVAWASREKTASHAVELAGETGYRTIGGINDALLFSMIFFDPAASSRGHKGAVVAGDRYQSGWDPGHPRYARGGQVYCIDSVSTAKRDILGRMQSVPVDEPGCIIVSMTISPSGRFIAWLDHKSRVTVLDSARGTRQTFQSGQAGMITYNLVAVSPGDEVLVAALAAPGRDSWRTYLSAWETDSGRPVWSWETEGIVGGLSFSPDGRVLAALNTEGALALFDMREQAALRTVERQGEAGPASAVATGMPASPQMVFPCLAFSPDGSQLVTSGDRGVRLWRLP